jgi:hypothetical protein
MIAVPNHSANTPFNSIVCQTPLDRPAFCSVFLLVTKSNMPAVSLLHSSSSSSVSSPAYSEPESGSSVKALRLGTEGVRRVVMDSFDSTKGGEWEMLHDCADGNTED